MYGKPYQDLIPAVAAAVLSLVFVPQLSFGQIPPSDLQQPSVNQPQCLDFNQDKVCEFMVLANGTTVENPTSPAPTSIPTPTATTKPIEGTCMGFITSPTYCKNLKMPDGSVVENADWTHKKYTKDANEIYAGSPFVGSTDQTQTQTQVGTCMGYETSPTYCKLLKTPDGSVVENTEWTLGKYTVELSSGCIAGYQQIGNECIPESEFVSNDGDGDGGDSTPDTDTTDEAASDNPYCDLVSDSYTGDCHDRRDYSEDTGLSTCRDGSHVEDYRDCKDAGSHPDETEVEIEASGRPSCDDVPAGTNCDDINDEDSTVTYNNEDDEDEDVGIDITDE